MDKKKIIMTVLGLVLGAGAGATGASLVRSLFDKVSFGDGFKDPTNWIIGAVVGVIIAIGAWKGKIEKK